MLIDCQSHLQHLKVQGDSMAGLVEYASSDDEEEIQEVESSLSQNKVRNIP